jgi:hypothetical protein
MYVELLRHRVGDAYGDRSVERRTVVRLTAVFLVEQLDDLAGARQAPDVGREDPLVAQSHSFGRGVHPWPPTRPTLCPTADEKS